MRGAHTIRYMLKRPIMPLYFKAADHKGRGVITDTNAAEPTAPPELNRGRFPRGTQDSTQKLRVAVSLRRTTIQWFFCLYVVFPIASFPPAIFVCMRACAVGLRAARCKSDVCPPRKQQNTFNLRVGGGGGGAECRYGSVRSVW